jgi:hypothetical protein
LGVVLVVVVSGEKCVVTVQHICSTNTCYLTLKREIKKQNGAVQAKNEVINHTGHPPVYGGWARP